MMNDAIVYAGQRRFAASVDVSPGRAHGGKLAFTVLSPKSYFAFSPSW